MNYHSTCGLSDLPGAYTHVISWTGLLPCPSRLHCLSSSLSNNKRQQAAFFCPISTRYTGAISTRHASKSSLLFASCLFSLRQASVSIRKHCALLPLAANEGVEVLYPAFFSICRERGCAGISAKKKAERCRHS